MKYLYLNSFYKIKNIMKNFIIPPKVWLFITKFYHLNISKKDKTKNQYPYSWNGQNFKPKEYSENFDLEMQKSKVCVTRQNDTKFCILVKKNTLIKIKKNTKIESISFSISPMSEDTILKNVSVKSGEKLLTFIKGNLVHDKWIYVSLTYENLEGEFLEFNWSGGHLYLSDFTYIYKDNKKLTKTNSKRNNIIVLVLDSILPENIKLMNPSTPSNTITPYIDSFFKCGTIFNNAFTISEYTMPSLVTMMTGLYPIEHGVFTHDKNQRTIPTNIPTLAETLKNNGYKTFGYSTGQRFSPLYGHYRGFDRFLSHNPYRSDKTADNQINLLTEFLEINKNSSCFGFLHILDPHPPFAANTYFTDMNANDFRWSDGKQLYADFKMHRDSTNLVNELKKVEKVMVSNLDFILSKLFSYIEYVGLRDNTTIFLLSDHGRIYNKRKPLLQNNLTRIPLLISGHNQELILRNDFVQPSLDLYPTIMKMCGIDKPKHLSGKDLTNPIKNNKHSYSISESLFRRDGEIAINDKDWLYALNCEFDYMEGFFNFNSPKGQWLFKKDVNSKIEDTSVNFIDKGYKIQNKFLEIVKDHYVNRKRYFSSEDIIKETKNYPE